MKPKGGASSSPLTEIGAASQSVLKHLLYSRRDYHREGAEGLEVHDPLEVRFGHKRTFRLSN
jgi:hypothetical protein